MTKNFSWKFYIVAAFIISVCILTLYWLVFNIGMGWYDLPGQRQLCAYVLRGIDPYPYIGIPDIPASVQEIGTIPEGWGAVPWGLVLGNIYYFGFMSLDGAKTSFLVLNFIMAILTALCLYFYAEKIYPDKKFAVLVLLLAMSSPDFVCSVTHGNAGGIICCFLLLAWMFCDDRPVLTGILLGFAMVKPQIALIVCILFLLQKRFISLATAALIDIAAWFYASLKTGTGMIALLQEFMLKGAGSDRRYSGIFTIFLENRTYALTLSMIAGILFVLIFHYLCRMNFKNDKYNFAMCFSFMASTFWSYSYNNDNYVLLLPAVICIYIMLRSEKFYERILWLLLCFYCNYGVYIRSGSVFKFIFGHEAGPYAIHVIKTIYELGIIIAAIMIYIYLSRKHMK